MLSIQRASDNVPKRVISLRDCGSDELGRVTDLWWRLFGRLRRGVQPDQYRRSQTRRHEPRGEYVPLRERG